MNLDQFFTDGWHWTWVTVLIASVVFTALFKMVSGLISKILRKFTLKTASRWDDIVLDLLDGLKSPVLFVWLFHFFSRSLNFSPARARALSTLVIAATVFQISIWGLHLIRNWRDTVLVPRTRNDPSATAALGLISVALQGLFLVLICLVGLSHLGVDIGALLAGLGVGGIAVALAAQNVLGDLLASLSIILDKPFVIGDFIVSGTEMGTVEHIGVKTTRLRSLSGEQLIFSNKDLLESRLRNYKNMRERRVVQNFGVTYSTPADSIEQIAAWVKEIIDTQPDVRFDRCHFAKFGDSSLDYEFVFWVKNPDYNIYMNAQQKILVSIFRKFEAEGVSFAFPTRTIQIESDETHKALSR